jgi:hypothetical protein
LPNVGSTVVDFNDPRREELVARLLDVDRLSLLVGRVAQMGALLESEMRELLLLLRLLVHGDLGAKAPFFLGDIIKECRSHLGNEVLAPWHTEGVATLDVAEAAAGQRNRIVHDRWLTSHDGSTWSQLQTLKADPWTEIRDSDFDAAEQARLDLRAAVDGVRKFQSSLVRGQEP